MVKPPPPPPKFRGAKKPAPLKRSFETIVRQLKHYKLPMATETTPAWVAVLKECGFPGDVLVLDFETYFDPDFRMAGTGDGLSTIEYIADPRFEILGLAWLHMQTALPFRDYEANTAFVYEESAVDQHIKYLQSQFGDNLERCTVVMQNAAFDGMILARKYGIVPPRTIDTLGLSRHWNARSRHGLEHLAKQFGLPEKGNTSEFSGLTFRTRFVKPKGRTKGPKLPVQVPKITDEQIVALSDYARNDVMREWELFTLLLPKLSRPKVELRLMQHTLELFWRPSIAVDQEKGAELTAAMQGKIDEVLEAVGCTHKEISGDTSFDLLLNEALIAAGEEPGEIQRKYYKPCKRGYMLAIAKTDPERELLANHADERVRLLMKARSSLDSWPLHIKRVERICNQAKAAGGLLPVPLRYCGAHTGRWAGGEKINLQNLGSRGADLITAVRELLIAPPGKRLIITDASQIEARVLAWIAGQDDLVQKFANGEDVYCDFATEVLGYRVRKPKRTGIEAIEKRMSWARNAIGKVGILGSGYGMGTARIFDYAQGEIDYETADKIKTTYRSKNHRIVQFWKDIERAFAYTAKYGEPCEMPRGLRFHQAPDCDVVLTLPSGRELTYHKVRVEPGEYGDTLAVWNGVDHSWGHVWGGHLTENVVQAMSRDILAEAMLRLEDMGHHIALHVHDEIVLVVDEADADRALADSIRELSRRPEWALDCPLAAEGQIAVRYGK